MLELSTLRALIFLRSVTSKPFHHPWYFYSVKARVDEYFCQSKIQPCADVGVERGHGEDAQPVEDHLGRRRHLSQDALR